MQLRHHVADLRARQQRRALDDDGTVQMLAALGGKKNAALVQRRIQSFVHRLGGIQTGAFADALPHDFTGRAADDKDISALELRGVQQFLQRTRSLFPDLLIIHLCLLSFKPYFTLRRLMSASSGVTYSVRYVS